MLDRWYGTFWKEENALKEKIVRKDKEKTTKDYRRWKDFRNNRGIPAKEQTKQKIFEI